MPASAFRHLSFQSGIGPENAVLVRYRIGPVWLVFSSFWYRTDRKLDSPAFWNFKPVGVILLERALLLERANGQEEG